MTGGAPLAQTRADDDRPDNPELFISYASDDLARAEALHARLAAAGRKVWFDKARLSRNCDWHQEIKAGCEAARLVLPLITPCWNRSECGEGPGCSASCRRFISASRADEPAVGVVRQLPERGWRLDRRLRQLGIDVAHQRLPVGLCRGQRIECRRMQAAQRRRQSSASGNPSSRATSRSQAAPSAPSAARQVQAQRKRSAASSGSCPNSMRRTTGGNRVSRDACSAKTTR